MNEVEQDILSSKVTNALMILKKNGFEFEVSKPKVVSDIEMSCEIMLSEQAASHLVDVLRKDPELCGKCLRPIEQGWIACPHCGARIIEEVTG